MDTAPKSSLAGNYLVLEAAGKRVRHRHGCAGGTRTHGLRLRRPMPYPTGPPHNKLQVHPGLHGSSPGPLGTGAATPVGGRSIRSAGRSQPVIRCEIANPGDSLAGGGGENRTPVLVALSTASTCVVAVPVFPGAATATRQSTLPKRRVFPPQSSPIVASLRRRVRRARVSASSPGGAGVLTTYAARATAVRAPKSTLTIDMSLACKSVGTLITGPERHPRHATCVRSRQVENLFAPFASHHSEATNDWYG